MKAVNGSMIWPTAEMTGEDRSQPGKLEFLAYDNGLPDNQEWYVMMLTLDTMAIYYCGNILDQWRFEGFLVLSRFETMNPDREDDLKLILEDLEISEDDICVPDPVTYCQSAPTEEIVQ